MQLDLNGSFKIQELEVKFKPHRKHSGVDLMSPLQVHKFLAPLLADEPREKLVGLFVDTRNELVAYEVISQGTSNSSFVSPREVFKTAFLTNAAALILAHNHPSENVEPSEEDRAICRRLQGAAELLDFQLLDFMVISRKNFYSFAESDPEFRISSKEGVT